MSLSTKMLFVSLNAIFIEHVFLFTFDKPIIILLLILILLIPIFFHVLFSFFSLFINQHDLSIFLPPQKPQQVHDSLTKFQPQEHESYYYLLEYHFPEDNNDC